jgi:hypothetical protein
MDDLPDEPCSELDKMVAEHVLGLSTRYDFVDNVYLFLDKMSQQWLEIPKFSSDTTLAYEIVNFLQTKGFSSQIGSESGESDAPLFRCSFTKNNNNLMKVAFIASHKVLAVAICKSALNVIRGKEEVLKVEGADGFDRRLHPAKNNTTVLGLPTKDQNSNVISFKEISEKVIPFPTKK